MILQADHDLNNLIQQYYVPRLIAEVGEGGMGKGMDGHAGKDLIIKVPCGTLVWQLSDTTPPIEKRMRKDDDEEEEADEEKPVLSATASQRPIFRSSRGLSALEIDMSQEGESSKDAADDTRKGTLVADLLDGRNSAICFVQGRTRRFGQS